MKSKFLAIFLLCSYFLTTHLTAQEKSFRVGLQSSINLSSVLARKEIENLPGKQFLGLSLGVTFRQQLFRSKHRLGRIKSYIDHAIETGLTGGRQGFAFNFSGQEIGTEFFYVQLPIIWVFVARPNAFTPRYFKKHKIQQWVKGGIVLSAMRFPDQQTPLYLANRNQPVFQRIEKQTSIHPFVYVALGLQRKHQNGAISSLGISVQSTSETLFNSVLLDPDHQIIERSGYRRNGSLIAIDCQYFFGNRKKRASQDNKTIYNPRFL